MKNPKILIRFDDICPTMNWEQWNRAKRVLDSIGRTALLGVIPDNHDKDLMIDAPREDFWEYIKDLQHQGFVIAMHGYQHVFDIQASGLSTPKKHSEFAGHTYEEQNRRIREGKKILAEHGINTDIFFAPAHSYDDNTLKALAANGFHYISDGKSFKPYKCHGIICLPERMGGIPRIKNNGGYYTVVLHAHEWEKEGGSVVREKFESMLSVNSDNVVSFDIYKKQLCGPAVIERFCERSYLWLAYIKHKIVKRLM